MVDVVLHDNGTMQRLAGDPHSTRPVGGVFDNGERLLYARVSYQSNGVDLWELATREGIDSPPQLVLQWPHPLVGAWTLGHRVVFVSYIYPTNEAGALESSLWLLDLDTEEVTELESPIGPPGPGFVIGHPASPYVALVGPWGLEPDPDHVAVAGFLHVVSGQWGALPAGWLPQCFDPAGSHVLVTEIATGSVGLVEVTDPARIVRIGTIEGDVAGCAWVEKGAEG